MLRSSTMRPVVRHQMLTLPVDADGQQIPSWEKQVDRLSQHRPATSGREPHTELLTKRNLEPMMQRELVHRALLPEHPAYEARLVGWAEVYKRKMAYLMKLTIGGIVPECQVLTNRIRRSGYPVLVQVEFGLGT